MKVTPARIMTMQIVIISSRSERPRCLLDFMSFFPGGEAVVCERSNHCPDRLKVASVNNVPNFSVLVHFRNALRRDQSTKGPQRSIGLLASRGSLSSHQLKVLELGPARWLLEG